MDKAARNWASIACDAQDQCSRGNSPWGFPEKKGRPQDTVSSARVREALDRGAELFKWEERKKRSGQRSGTKIRGVSATIGAFFSGTNGFDGLLVIKPDGKLYVHQGIGNHGTYSVSDTARVAAETLGMPWDQVEVVWGTHRQGCGLEFDAGR